ncbi:alpha/beta hydrolase [Parvibaculum sp.]|uniref:alpha/beta hydrolase n=1 Tax=Parvibaculum sp. TaxID=2024848 RepID=UPI001D81C545|nr:alpha/beta hydrolase [Parvibaculum sp.]MBX3489124.1 alpha/beta hydrolase [Parvibaculum sp.]MCW5727003.1 alpha/beta hydrolase [Parvibaculum sp.]
MASIQARLTDRMLRLLVKSRFNPQADPRAIRARTTKLAQRFGGVPRGVRVERAAVAGIPAEWIHPQVADNGNTLLYLHGGGYSICGPDTHRGLVARLASAAKMRALLLDYRLASEHPFPAAVEDAYAAYKSLLAEGTDPSRLTVAGDSAGGGLTLALLMKLRDAHEPLPAGAALLSPWTDLAMSGWSHITHGKLDPMLSVDAALTAARHYLQGASPAEPLASPLYGNFERLPPLLIHVGANEILLDDSRRVAEKAQAAGVEVTLRVWPGVPHVFQAFPQLPEARASVAEIGAYLHARAITGGPSRRAAD